jgi:predicted DNA-binding protein (MmcQ/YjbR family)
MASPTASLKKLRQICLCLPDAVEDEKWGKPHFCVGKKIFAGCGEENDKFVVGFKLELGHAKSMVAKPGFWKAPYVGHQGWVSMDPAIIDDWKLIEELVHESFRLIAPKRTLAKLDSLPRPQPASAKIVGKKKSASRGKKKTTGTKKEAGSKAAKENLICKTFSRR